jgi:hypothetical protein
MYKFNLESHTTIQSSALIKETKLKYRADVPFYNNYTGQIEVTKSARKGIYPVGVLSILVDGNGIVKHEDYNTNIIHNYFNNNTVTTPSLYDHQKIVYKNFKNHYDACVKATIPCVTTIQAPCGFGKSETTIKIIHKLKVRTIIIVKTKILVNHWCSYFEKYNFNYYGSYDGVKTLLEKYESDPNSIPDILVIVSRHVENDRFIEFIQENYTLCIIDEVHSWNLSGNSELSKFVMIHPLPINIYLTATPNKKDAVIYGHHIEAQRHTEFFDMNRYIIDYTKRDQNIVTLENIYQAGENPLEGIQSDKSRNQTIITCILDNLLSCSIVFCNRRLHMKLLFLSIGNCIKKLESCDESLFSNVMISEICITFSFKGKVKEDIFILMGDAEYGDIHNLISNLGEKKYFTMITTVQFCACGLNLPAVTNIMLATSKIQNNDLKQAVGRAERAPYNTDRFTFIFWVTDDYNKGNYHTVVNNMKVPITHIQSNNYTNFIKDCHDVKTTLVGQGWKTDYSQ